MEKIADVARGKWPFILGTLGVHREALQNKHGPCPCCGGKDRFRFDDKEGAGTFFCSHCGAGTGYKLAMLVTGWDTRKLSGEIRKIAGGARVVRRQSKPKASTDARVARILAKCSPLSDDGPVRRYLAGRGIGYLDGVDLLETPNLPYWDNRQRVGSFPAMVARAVGPDGDLRTLHVTYLTVDGKKAPVPAPKKIVSKIGDGACVRLFPRATVLGVAEGIETALAARELFGLPTWAALSTHGLETFQPVGPTREVVIYADNDESMAGQAAAYSLAKRLRAADIFANVAIPDAVGTDWADCLKR